MPALFHSLGKVNKGNLVKKLEFARGMVKSFWFLNSLFRFLAVFFLPKELESGWCIVVVYRVHEVKFCLENDFF